MTTLLGVAFSWSSDLYEEVDMVAVSTRDGVEEEAKE